jgi:L-malate glycosyltransferase
MKLLYFSRAYTTHDRRFLQKIAERLGAVYYVQLEDDGVSYENRPLPAGVEKVPWAGGTKRYSTPDSFLSLLADLDSTIETIRPDVIQAGPVLSCALLVALLGFRPLLTVSWGSDILVEADLTDWNKWAARFTLHRSDLFICDCLPVMEKAQRLAPVPDERVVMFPWGIELKRYVRNDTPRSSGRNALGWGDCCVVVSTRTWDAGYSIDLVVDVFAEAYRSNPSLRLLLLGSGPVESAIRQQIKRHGLDYVVHCPGRVTEDKLVDVLLLADIYLCCTPSDGTSISLLEAMAMRLPVVAADNPGNRQWVANGINGRLARVGDAHEFSAALLQMSMDPEARIRMGNAGRETVEQRADWNKNVTLLLEAYHNLDKLPSRWQT